MSTGGIFQLIANDGAQDKLLMATELLNRRLKEIHRLRCKHPAIRDPTPTLVDIERTHILFINSHFKPFVAVGYEYTKIGVDQGVARLGSEVTFSIPQYGDFFNDMVFHVQLTGLTTIPGNQVRYCEFLGHRLVQRVRFEVNGNFLDEYDSEVHNFHYAFTVEEGKRTAWKRNVGQEVPQPAYLTQNPGVDEYREVKQIVNGPQTPKATHQIVDLWIPLLFWFNADPRLAIPSVSIPYGQRFIRILLASPDLIAQGTPAAIFTPPVLATTELYINNIFVNPEIHDIFIKRVGFNLIRVHRQQKITINSGTDSIKLDSLKYPTETLYIGARPQINNNSMEDWDRYHFVTNNLITYPTAIPNPIPPPANLLAFTDAHWKTATRVLDTIKLELHAIEIYHETPTEFFNSYLPYTYGNSRIHSPDDIGMYMVTFNLYPGSYQPSGHLNLSRSREFFLTYKSAIASPAVPCDLVIIAIAINFLLVSDGSAVLRYNL
jgi:hypothetical protein